MYNQQCALKRSERSSKYTLVSLRAGPYGLIQTTFRAFSMHRRAPPSWIEKYVGLKFGDKGRGPDEFDCWGLVRWIYMNEFEVVLPDYMGGYSTVTDDEAVETTVLSGINDGWTKIDNPVTGDVVLFNIFGKPVHVGIVAGSDYFLHSPEDDFSRRERLSDRMWKNRIEGFYRHDRLLGHGEASPT